MNKQHSLQNLTAQAVEGQNTIENFMYKSKKKRQEIFPKNPTITKHLSRAKENILELREVQDIFEVHTRKILSGKQRLRQ